MVHYGLIDLGFLGLGMAMGRGKSEGWGLYPRSAWFYFTPSSPHLSPHDREIFFSPFPPLGAQRKPVIPRKTLLLIYFLTTITIVFNKKNFVNKNIHEITNKFIPSNQTNF